jgi:hypothetical protein
MHRVARPPAGPLANRADAHQAAGHSVARMQGGRWRCRSCEKAAARADIDPVAVERALTGRAPQLMRAADRRAAVRALSTTGEPASRAYIAALVASSPSTVVRDQKSMGIQTADRSSR